MFLQVPSGPFRSLQVSSVPFRSLQAPVAELATHPKANHLPPSLTNINGIFKRTTGRKSWIKKERKILVAHDEG